MMSLKISVGCVVKSYLKKLLKYFPIYLYLSLNFEVFVIVFNCISTRRVLMVYCNIDMSFHVCWEFTPIPQKPCYTSTVFVFKYTLHFEIFVIAFNCI